MSNEIDIKDLPKSRVLQALFQRAFSLRLGARDPRHRYVLGRAEAEATIAELANLRAELYFDYLHGRVLKVDITGDTFDPALYDRDNGPGAAQYAIQRLRESIPCT